MRSMKSSVTRYIAMALLVFSCSFFVVGNFALAGDAPGEAPTEAPSTLTAGLDTAAKESGLTTSTTVTAYVGKIIGIALQYLGIIFIILIIYAGILWMTANGDHANVKKAYSWMINATIGLAITLMAYQVTSYIMSKIQISG